MPLTHLDPMKDLMCEGENDPSTIENELSNQLMREVSLWSIPGQLSLSLNDAIAS